MFKAKEKCARLVWDTVTDRIHFSDDFPVVQIAIDFLIKTGSRSYLRFVSSFARFMDKIADVDIDASGRFKYILIKIVEKSSKNSKLIVRGYSRCNYHGKRTFPLNTFRIR